MNVKNKHDIIPLEYYKKIHESQEKQLYPALKELIGNNCNLRICDFGSGNGRFWSGITGIDELHLFDPEINRLKNLMTDLKCDLKIFDDINLLPENFYDLVLSCLVMMSIHDEDELISSINKIFKILKKDKFAYIAITHPAFIDRKHFDFSTSYYSHKQKFNYFSNHDKFNVELFWNDSNSVVDIIDAHRSLSYYINSFVNNGLLIKSVYELPSSKDIDSGENQYPSYLIFKLQKIGD